MRLTESHLRSIVREEIQSLKESRGDNWSYSIHLDNLYQLKDVVADALRVTAGATADAAIADALYVAQDALSYSKKSPLGEDPDLEDINKDLEDINKALEDINKALEGVNEAIESLIVAVLPLADPNY